MTMRKIFCMIALAAMVAPLSRAQDDFDDIYYNPKKDNKESAAKATDNGKKRKSNYIADFGSIDVDDYNRRSDFYYTTAVDTIGQQTENGEDFVYTQQIQKFYNPTIVVDNSDVLADVLEDSYGNVDIVIENGYPAFTSIYTGGYAWAPSYYNWCLSPSWRWSFGWGPAYASWTWGPSWAWGYDPYWSWGPSYGWGWGPSWGYYPPRPGWGPPLPPSRPTYGYHRPNPGATRPTSPNAGWSANTRPGGVYNGTGRPASTRRPGSATTSRPTNGSSVSGYPRRGHRGLNGTSTVNNGNGSSISGTRRWGTTNRTIKGTANTQSTVTNDRVVTNGSNRTNNRSYGTGRTTNNSSNRSYNTTTNRNRSYNSGSSYRSGGSRSTGTGRGTGVGRSSGGGGGHRGGRR